jgi:alpha-galactosidase
MSAVRIGIIGAGSAIFSMRLVSDICKTQNLKGSEVVLMDIDEDRLKAVSFLAQRISDEFDADIRFSTTTNVDKAIANSNFVINSALVGGHSFLEKMRKIGEKHGYTRGIDTQEFNMVSDYYTLTNWNQLSYFLEIAQKMEHNGVKNPWLLQAANPVFEGTTLIHRQTSTNMVGFCHGHHEVKQLAEAIKVPFWEIEWQVAGVNHGIWLNKFERDGKSLYPRLEEYFNNRKEWHPKIPPMTNFPRWHGTCTNSTACSQSVIHNATPAGNITMTLRQKRNGTENHGVDLIPILGGNGIRIKCMPSPKRCRK